MSVSTTINRVAYAGNGTTTSFGFPYYFRQTGDLQLYLFSAVTFVVVPLVQGTDYTVSGTPNAQGIYTAGGVCNLTVAPPVNTAIVIVRSPTAVQNFSVLQNGVISSTALTQQLDYLTLLIQRLGDHSKRSARLPDGASVTFDPTIPVSASMLPFAPLTINSTGTGFMFATASTAGASGLLPTGGAAGNVLILDSTSAAKWSTFAYSGYSARFGAAFTSVSLDDTLSQILNLQYAAPSISLSASGNGAIYEKGSPITSSTLTATITKRSNTIAAVRFYQGASLIYTAPTPPTNGGTSAYSWTGSITDNTTFNAQADDNAGSGGGPTTVSASASFTFVYPYYVGAGAAGLSPAQVAALTKRVITSSASRTETITATAGQYFYFAYPAAYGPLTSILDVNGFQTISDWTQSTINITGLDATSQSYYSYKFNNSVAAGSYQYTFTR